MANIESIVDVVISLAARPITTAGFETPLFLSTHKVFDERFRIYSTLQGVLDDGFDSDSEVGKAVAILFSGTFKPRQVVVGRRDFTAETLTVTTPTSGDDITVTIAGSNSSGNGKSTVTITSAGDATADATALALAITNDVTINSYVDATASGAVVTLARDADARVTFVGETTSNLVLAYTDHEDMDDAIQAVVAANADFFFIASDSRVEEDILDLASYAEATKRIYGVATYDADILVASDTTDILSQLRVFQYDNTIVVPQTAAQIGEYHEMAIFGSMASTNAGTSTIHGKTLRGVSISDFSDSQLSAIAAKNGTAYIEIAGVGFALDGKMVSGQFFDNIRGALWLEARLEEDVFSLIKREADLGRKIPYTNTGAAMIASVIEVRLAQAVQRGFLSDDPATPPVVTIPLVTTIPVNSRIERNLPDVDFTAVLAGAIHRVITLRGYITA